MQLVIACQKVSVSLITSSGRHRERSVTASQEGESDLEMEESKTWCETRTERIAKVLQISAAALRRACGTVTGSSRSDSDSEGRLRLGLGLGSCPLALRLAGPDSDSDSERGEPGGGGQGRAREGEREHPVPEPR